LASQHFGHFLHCSLISVAGPTWLDGLVICPSAFESHLVKQTSFGYLISLDAMAKDNI